MDISAHRAYILFGFYRSRSTLLHIGGKIGGQEAACEGTITAVERERQRITIELSDPGSSQVWRRVIPLRDAAFSLHLLGEDDYEDWVAKRWHSVLVIKYQDETTLFFAERMP